MGGGAGPLMAVNRLLALIAAAASLFATAQAQAVEPSAFRTDPFAALVGKRKPAQERAAANASVDRYVIATDDRVFLFQSSAGEGRLKFLCGNGDRRISCVIDEINPAEEIHELSAARVSRGDVIWRNREGQALLRVAAYGGVTVFWPGDTRGHAASKSFGEDPPLVLDFASIGTARTRAQTATALISAKVGSPVVFDIGDPGPDSAGGATVLADAVARAADGVAAVAEDPTGARVIAARIRHIRFRPMASPALGFESHDLTVGYNPSADVAGRPSSARIARFLEESL